MKPGILHTALYFLFSLAVLISCTDGENHLERGALLAEVGSKKLYEKDIEYIFNDPGFEGDSNTVISSYINSWVRDQSLIIDAEKNVESTAEIDRMVEDYRAALLKHSYENQRISQEIDTSILKMEMENFYNDQPEQFLSSGFFVRLRLAGFEENRSNIWPLRNEVYNENLPDRDLEEIVDLNEGEWILNPYFWYSYDVVNDVTDNRLNKENIIPGFEFSYNSDGNRYFLKIIDTVNEGEALPYQMVEDKIKKLILIERRKELVKDLRNEVYENKMRNQQVKIHYP